MATLNYFIADAPCPACAHRSALNFQADIGALRYDVYRLGDVVDRYPGPRERVRIGPDPHVDWTRPFWAAGLARCPNCQADVLARIEIRDARYAAATIDQGLQDLYAWGYLDER